MDDKDKKDKDKKDKDKKDKDKKREELLKSARFAEKFLGGLTQEHYKSKFEEMVKEEDDLFIWEKFFQNDKKKKSKKEDELFPWGFLFDKNKKKKK